MTTIEADAERLSRQIAKGAANSPIAIAPSTPDTRTIVVDGVEYEAQSIGSRPMGQWPDHGLPRGSSLSGVHAVKTP